MARTFGENMSDHSLIGQEIEKALNSTIATKSFRPQKLSPSMFPCCSVIQRMKWYMFDYLGYLPYEDKCALSIYAGAGTVMHEKLQLHMGQGGKLWGHWNCKNPKCEMSEKARSVYDKNGKRVKKGVATRTYTTNNVCPKCGRPMEYKEFKITYGYIKGFVDGIIKMPDGTFWIIDFKSATVNKCERGEFFNKKHGIQLSAYVAVLEKKYNLKISGYSLFYVPRDVPYKFKEKEFKWNKKEAARVMKMIRKEKKKYKAAKYDRMEGDTWERSVKAKPCQSTDQYLKEIHSYDDCPMLDYCFQPKRLNTAMKAWSSACRNKKVPEHVSFAEAVKIVTDKEFKRKRKLIETREPVERTKHMVL